MLDWWLMLREVTGHFGMAYEGPDVTMRARACGKVYSHTAEGR